jgi:hypothetical protein
MNYKTTDEFNRDLKKNVYIAKIKDVPSFVQLINNIHKSIIGKNNIKEFYYKFDRILSLKLQKLEDDLFQFEIFLKSVKSNFQVYIEDLYSLLYLFFIGISVEDANIDKDENSNYHATIKIKFVVSEEHNVLIKDTMLRIKHVKKIRRRRNNA